MPHNYTDHPLAEFALVETFGVLRKIRSGYNIIIQGDEFTGFYILRSGYVKILSCNETGDEILYRIQGPGSLFGELPMFDLQPRSASVVALSECEVVYVSTSKIHAMLEKQPEVLMSLFSMMAVRIRQLSESLSCQVSRTVYQRLKLCLEDMASKNSNQQALTVVVRHQDFASLLGTSREMVTKLLNGLQRAGYIDVDRKIIYLIRPLPGRCPPE